MADNFLGAYAQLEGLLHPLFGDDLVYDANRHSEMNAMTLFHKSSTATERVACAIKYRGYTAQPIVSQSRTPNQKLHVFWETCIVCDEDTYITVGGEKMAEVKNLLMGKKVGSNTTRLHLVDDEREFNQPDFYNNLAWLPMLWSVGVVQ